MKEIWYPLGKFRVYLLKFRPHNEDKLWGISGSVTNQFCEFNIHYGANSWLLEIMPLSKKEGKDV